MRKRRHDPAFSEEEIERRRALVPRIAYPEELPIAARREELLAALADHQVVVVAGETGSGKSTQLPKLCLELGRGAAGMIGHTQPRRVAARSIAERVASELGSPLGGTVGYAVRFNDTVGPDTLVKVMTDGILLAEIQRDPLLRRYDTIIVDEAHERTLNIDFLLGYLHRLLPRRPDLHLVITSATLDVERVAAHFGNAPIVEISGRTYPVEMRYRPVGAEPDDDRDQVQAVCDAIEELAREGPGDVLVFLSGEREIHDAADAVRRLDLPNLEVLPLYARLSAAEQHRVFQPHTGRRVVLSTNVAETSITVPGVRYVVDTGEARISRYSHRLHVQRLPIEPVAQSSANQRAGRCGRVAPGICIRLYGEDDFLGRPEFTEPEILRTSLASVILQMAALGLGDVAAFPFLDPPDHRSVRDGLALLEELGALDLDHGGDGPQLTPVGRRLAQLPIDPRFGRMVLEAERLDCVREVLVIASALSIQDVRETPNDQREQATALHRRFRREGSDFLGTVALWDYLREQQRALSGNQFRRLCRSEFLHYVRVREWQDLHSQLRQTAGRLGIRPGTAEAHPDRVHQALLAGLLSHLGVRDRDSREFRGARGAKFVLVPGSALAKKPPSWVVAAELVETSRLWGRVAAAVQPEWAERLGAHLVKRSYGEPEWSAERGTVTTTERVTLYGLPIVAGRRVGYARLDPQGAHELFVRHALVLGEWDTRHRFVERNRTFLEERRAWEERVRTPVAVVDDDRLEAFFAARVPPEISTVRQFDRWWRDERSKQPHLLDLTPEGLGLDDVGSADEEFPDAWAIGEASLPVTYSLDPGSEVDGTAVHVPIGMLNQIDADLFDWGVEGTRTALVEAVVRTLPKDLRRQLIPLADTAKAATAVLGEPDGPFAAAVAAAVTAVGGVKVRPTDVDLTRVDSHLRVTFVIHADDGSVLATGKDLPTLRRSLTRELRASLLRTFPGVERSGLTSWDLGTLPQTLVAERSVPTADPDAGRRRRPRPAGPDLGTWTVTAYPGLVDEGDTVSLRIFSNPLLQQRVMRGGVRRLLVLTSGVGRTHLERQLTNAARLAITRAGLDQSAFLDDCLTAVVDRILDAEGGVVWDVETFEQRRQAVRSRAGTQAGNVVRQAAAIVIAATELHARLDRLVAASLQPTVADARAHLDRLVRPGFVLTAGVDRLDDVARYVQGIGRRLDKVAADVAKDQRLLTQVRGLERRYGQLVEGGARGPDVTAVGWLLEELRVSLFAQTLGTAVPVSPARIERELARLT
jgi:ATP-dependent helicase HrpA